MRPNEGVWMQQVQRMLRFCVRGGGGGGDDGGGGSTKPAQVAEYGSGYNDNEI